MYLRERECQWDARDVFGKGHDGGEVVVTDCPRSCAYEGYKVSM